MLWTRFVHFRNIVCLPFNFHGSILLTIRNHEVTVEIDVGRDSIIPVEGMDELEAMQLLQKKANRSVASR